MEERPRPTSGLWPALGAAGERPALVAAGEREHVMRGTSRRAELLLRSPDVVMIQHDWAIQTRHAFRLVRDVGVFALRYTLYCR